MSTTARPKRALLEETAKPDGPWRPLVVGVVALLLGVAPTVAAAVAEGARSREAGGSAELSLSAFAYYGAVSSTLVMTVGFLALGLRLSRSSRGPIGAFPALFVVTVGLGVLVGSTLAALSHSPAQAMATAGLAAGYLVVAALSFVLLTAENRVLFTLGCALLYLPAVYWLAGLLPIALGEVGAELGAYVPYLLAAITGLVLGRLGWSTASRLLGWLGALLILTVGLAAQASLEAALTTDSPEQVGQWFWVSLQSALTPAGIAVVVGILIALIDARRR